MQSDDFPDKPYFFENIVLIPLSVICHESQTSPNSVKLYLVSVKIFSVVTPDRTDLATVRDTALDFCRDWADLNLV
jgi:hypothetical protein